MTHPLCHAHTDRPSQSPVIPPIITHPLITLSHVSPPFASPMSIFVSSPRRQSRDFAKDVLRLQQERDEQNNSTGDRATEAGAGGEGMEEENDDDEDTDLHSLLHGRSVMNTLLGGTDTRATMDLDVSGASGTTGGMSSTGGVNPLLGADQGNTSRSSRASASSSVPSLGNKTNPNLFYILLSTTSYPLVLPLSLTPTPSSSSHLISHTLRSSPLISYLLFPPLPSFPLPLSFSGTMTGTLPSIESLPLVATTTNHDDNQINESPMSSVHSDESVISFRRDSAGNNNNHNNGMGHANGGHVLNLSMASAEPTVTMTVQLEGVCVG